MEIKFNRNVIVINFSKVECYFVEKIWNLLGTFMILTKLNGN